MLFWLTFTFLASQLFAGIAIIADIFSFQFKERKKIITFFIIAASCVALHYLLLERYVAAIIAWLGIIRFFIAYKSTWKYWKYIFIWLFSLTTYLFFKDWFDLIVLAWMTFITIWVFQSDDKKLRLIMMTGTSCVILYNFLIFSPVWVLLESIFLTSNIVGYYRYYIRKKQLCQNSSQ